MSEHTEVFEFEDPSGATRRVIIEQESEGITIKPEGTGMHDGPNGPIYLDWNEGVPTICIWPDINSDRCSEIPLDKSLVSNFRKEDRNRLNLDCLPRIRLNDLDQSLRTVIEKIDPNLHDFILFCDGKQFVDIDFYFKDDPRIHEDGYAGCGIMEFTYDSSAERRLATIINVLAYYLDLQFDE